MSRTSTIARALTLAALLAVVAAHEGHVHGATTSAAAAAAAETGHAGHDMGSMSGMADDGSMDMGGDEHMSGMAGMKMWVHGTIGDDLLWFKSWHPSGPGATVGVCIALFVLAILDRYLHALWRACNAHWARGRVWFALPAARGEMQAYEDAGQVVFTSGTAASPSPRSLTQRSTATAAAGAAATAGSGLSGTGEAGRQEEKRGSNEPPAFSSTAAGDETVLEKPGCCGAGVPAACNCGCGGECGAPSSPAYYAAEATPDASRGLSKATSRTSRTSSHLPAAVAASLDPARAGRWSRPFRWSVDVPRGLLWTLITALHYALMLVVMTFQIWWIIAVVVGAGVGEMLFGRFGATR